MMKFKGLSTGVLAAVATLATSMQAATVVQVVGAGSSAMWQTAAIGAYVKLAGTGAQHYTIKGSCASGNCAQIHDSRSASILPEGGSLWVVWSSDQSKVWAYLSVDSVVGNRAYFAVPRTQLQIDPQTESIGGQNLIPSTLWGNDAASLPAAIYTALNNAPITAAFTDIRPEDAKFAECRVTSALDTAAYTGLGYGTGCDTLIGTQIKSAFSSAVANPVDFAITGSDPFSGLPVPAWTTISVGASPIVFLINRTNASGLGAPGVFKNISLGNLQKIYNGTECDSNAFKASGAPADVPVTAVLREPMSGTMNTTEFTAFRTSANPNNSQEVGINPSNPGNNPLNLGCMSGGGKRMRAIGTGEVIKSGVLPNKDSIGYAFFGFGNVAPLAGTSNYGYLQVGNVDPINASYTNGNLPTCTAPCPATAGSSFPNLRNGKYKLWSVLRMATDATGKNYSNAKALVTAIEQNINSTVPDFVPFDATGGDPGLKYYRAHYTQSGISPNNGLSGQKESGGDVGGCIEHVGPAPGVLNCHQ